MNAKTHAGTIKWFNATRGYGFIEPEAGGKDVFIHASTLEECGVDPTKLLDGQPVQYEAVTTDQGFEAVSVILLRHSGTIKWFNDTRGFGFIEPDRGGKDVFVHITAFKRTKHFDNDELEGIPVFYDLENGRKGRLQAASVVFAVDESTYLLGRIECECHIGAEIIDLGERRAAG